MSFSALRVCLVPVLVVLLLSACGSTPPKDFGGRWKPVNRFDQAPAEIPLYSSYVYQATPTDKTLKTMLARWAEDNALTLEYKLLSDYTLYKGVAHVTTSNPAQAATEVSEAYAAQGIHVEITSSAIVVSASSDTDAES